jgi:hypothetical protein
MRWIGKEVIIFIKYKWATVQHGYPFLYNGNPLKKHLAQVNLLGNNLGD